MNGREFNLTIERIIKSLPYKLRAPFLERAGLYDGVWYTVSEVAHYLNLREDECRERLQLAADRICTQLGSALEDYIRDRQVTDIAAQSAICRIAVATSAPRDPNEVAREMNDAARSLGATFTMLGQSGYSGSLVAALDGGMASRTPHGLVQIGSRSVDFICHVFATIFHQREAIGEHRGGRHLGVFGLCSKVEATEHQVMYLDADLANEECVDNWLATYGINRTCPPDEPFLFEPLE